MEGGITSLLILNIIHKNENSWGYMIKQEYQKINMNESILSDSTLYTTLRNLENMYGLVTSTMNDRRREYNLSQEGKTVINIIYDYWVKFIMQSLDYIQELHIPINQDLKERLK